jgi:peptidoglycan/LPS O-acetylase OafA/YrhL
MRKAELPALTGARFYAALIVYLSHVTVLPGMDAYSHGILWFDAGVGGVSVFFVLSGFILTYNYADRFSEGVSKSDYRQFIWDRLTKIYPVHLAMLAVMMPVQIYSPNLPLDWRAVPFHALMLQCFWPCSDPTFYQYLNVPSWSISCEWFFYLLAPGAMFLACGRARQWLLVAPVVVYAVGLFGLLHDRSDFTHLYFVSWFAPSRFVEFVSGIFLARLFIATSLRKSAIAPLIAQVAGLVLLFAGALYRAHAPWPLHGGLLYLPGAALLIYGLADGRGLLARHLGRATLVRLGAASFSLYLIHVPVLRITKGICMKLGWQVHSLAVFWMVLVGMFIVVQCAALIVFQHFEMPVQNRLRRLFRHHPLIAGGLVAP